MSTTTTTTTTDQAPIANILDVDSNLPPPTDAVIASLPANSAEVKEYYAKHFRQVWLWIFIIVTIIVLIICFAIAWGATTATTGPLGVVGTSYWDSLTKPGWGASAGLWGLFLIIGLLIWSWAVYVAWVEVKNNMKRWWILGLWIVSLILLMVFFGLFFSRNSDSTLNNQTFSRSGLAASSWVALVTAILVFILYVLTWEGGVGVRIGSLIFLVWIILATIFAFQVASDNPVEEGPGGNAAAAGLLETTR